MTDTEMLDAMDSGKVSLYCLSRSKHPHSPGQWEWYDLSVQPGVWREADSLRECILRLRPKK